MDAFLKQQRYNAGNKTYLIPRFQLNEVQRFFLPKLQSVGIQHVFFNPQDIEQLYKQKNLDPKNLEANLQVKQQSQVEKPPSRKPSTVDKDNGSKQQIEKIEEIKLPPARIRPQFPANKPITHFLHVPLGEQLKDIYKQFTQNHMDPNDQDALQPLQSMHITLLVVEARTESEIKKWEEVMRGVRGRLKKTRIAVRGVGIFPAKQNTNFTKVLYLKVDGIDQIIDELVGRALSHELINQAQLKGSNIIFDKLTQTYKHEHPHITLLKTNGEDIIDATDYLKKCGKLAVTGKVQIQQIRMSVMGSWNVGGQGYYDEIVVKSDK